MILFGFLWEIKLYPYGMALLWLKVLPLIPLLPDYFKDDYVLQWLTLIIWFFITEAIVRVPQTPRKLHLELHLACLGVSTLILAMAAVRKIKLNKLHEQKIVDKFP